MIYEKYIFSQTNSSYNVASCTFSDTLWVSQVSDAKSAFICKTVERESCNLLLCWLFDAL